jgi:hypothetical protein
MQRLGKPPTESIRPAVESCHVAHQPQRLSRIRSLTLRGPHIRLAYFSDKTRLVCPLWPRNVRVGANSPNLWPTMFSVMYTGINRFPLCTAIVCPTNSGKMTERRDHVRMIRFSVPRFMAATLSNNLPSINGPFFSERATLFSLDHTRQITCGVSRCIYRTDACRVSWRL